MGALISGVKFESVNHKYILCIAYPIITPLGAAIGIAIRHDFNENSPSAILSVGILGSISAGILFYNTYSELISTEVYCCIFIVLIYRLIVMLDLENCHKLLEMAPFLPCILVLHAWLF